MSGMPGPLTATSEAEDARWQSLFDPRVKPA